MKKSIFILAALCAATFANAQITLEKTYNGLLEPFTSAHPVYLQKYVYGDLYIVHQFNSDQSYTVVVYDAYSYDEVTRFIIPTVTSWFVAAHAATFQIQMK